MRPSKVGIIGAGSFGITIASLVSKNADVILQTRNQSTLEFINKEHRIGTIELDENIVAISDLEHLARECTVILPMVPSASFRDMMKDISPYLRPEHIMIHGTKGLDIVGQSHQLDFPEGFQVDDVRTMSQVIQEESSVVRVGCLSGPNISKEILEGQPTATVVASEYNEVINLGKEILASNQFFVFGSNSIIGAELAGALKNYIALGAGILEGHGMGRNMQALLITRGLREIIHISKLYNTEVDSFLGTAGIGDLFATATSKDSRNFQIGMKIANGLIIDDIISNPKFTAEGIRTLAIANQLAQMINTTAPITKLLYAIVFKGFNFEKAIQSIMRYPFTKDVDFLE
jgi:glycerol-3-phosphate dehydrogenase (NAD(P)+)